MAKTETIEKEKIENIFIFEDVLGTLKAIIHFKDGTARMFTATTQFLSVVSLEGITLIEAKGF